VVCPDYHSELAVGCICAMHMEEDYVAPRLRERRLRTVIRRRTSWARRSWNTSARGNPYVNTDGFNVVVFEIPAGGWKIRIARRDGEAEQNGGRVYPTQEAAQAAALNALLWAKQKLAR
jgi:hypothetical protein